jgi:hypothetical protein
MCEARPGNIISETLSSAAVSSPAALHLVGFRDGSSFNSLKLHYQWALKIPPKRGRNVTVLPVWITQPFQTTFAYWMVGDKFSERARIYLLASSSEPSPIHWDLRAFRRE